MVVSLIIFNSFITNHSTFSPDNTFSTNSTTIALSSLIVVISIPLMSVLACVLGCYIIKWKYKSTQDTKEVVTTCTKVNVTDDSAYGITQEHLYEEIDSFQSLRTLCCIIN